MWKGLSESMIVVTGASGFLGRQVVAEATKRGLPVAAVARRTLAATPGARIVQVDGYAELGPDGDDVLVHLAGPRDASVTEKEIGHAVELCAALFARPWRHVVYASSAVVYGDAVERPRRSDEPPAPVGAYAGGKVACEALACAAGGSVARLANLYGPGMAPNSVTAAILAQIPGNGPVRVRDAAPVRDFLWVVDAAAGVVTMATQSKPAIHNLGSGIGIAVGDLARTALAVAGESHREVVATAPAGRRSHIVLDPEETTAAIGWRAATPLARGLQQLVAVRP
jgi:UDP-glucose 4-epimerase